MKERETQPGAAPLPAATLARLLTALRRETDGRRPARVRFRGGHSNDVTELRFADGRALIVKRGRYPWAAARFATAERAARLLGTQRELLAPRPLALPPELRAEPLQAYWRLDLPTLERLWPRLTAAQRRSALRSWGRLTRALHGVQAPAFAALPAGPPPPGGLQEWLRVELAQRLLPAVQDNWPEGDAPLRMLLARAPEAARRAGTRSPVLVHNDLHFGNVLCSVRGDEIRCVGLLDLEAALGGLPEMDAASAAVLHGPLFGQALPGGWLRAWRTGYGAPLDNWLLGFFRAYHLANQGFYSAFVGHDVHARSVLRALRRVVRSLAPPSAAAVAR